MEQNLEFREEQMNLLVERDAYLKFVFRDLLKKGNSSSNALEVLFNANVLDDSMLMTLYEKCGQDLEKITPDNE